MALQKQILEIPLDGALDTKSNAKLVQPGSMLVVENGEFGELGAVKKRNGYQAISRTILGGGSLVSGTAMFSDGKRLLAHGATAGPSRLYQHVEEANRWADAGIIYPGTIRTKRMARNTSFGIGDGDVAHNNGYALYAWEGSGNTVHALIDVATDTAVWESSITGMLHPQVIASGKYIYLVAYSGSNVNLYALDTSTNPNLSSFNTPAAILQNNLSASGISVFDIGSLGDGVGVLAYRTTAPSVKVQRFDHTGSMGSSLTVAENVDADSGVGVVVSSSLDTYVIYRQTTTRNIRCFAVTSAVASRFSPVTVEVDASVALFFTQYTGIETAPNVIALYYGASATVGGLVYSRIRTATITSAGAVSAVGVAVYGMYITSKPFIRDGRVYVFATYGLAEEGTAPDFQFTLFLVDLTGSTSSYAQIAGRIFPGEAVPRPAELLSSVAVLSNAKMLLAKTASSVSATTVGSKLYLPVSVELDFGAPPRQANLAGSLFLTGMVGHIITPGSAPVSCNFQLAPEIISLAQSSGGGGALTDGAYLVTAVYMRFDTNGELAVSAPAVAKSITISGGPKKIDIIVSSPKCDKVDYIHYYLTSVNGQTFYESARTTAPVASADRYSVSLLTVLTSGRILYTDGGVLANGAPPPMLSVVAKGRRLYGVTHDAGLFYTKELVGDLAASFSPDFMFKRLLDDGGGSYEIAEMDGNLVIFGARSVQALAGGGLNLTGTSDDLGDPRRLSTDTGSIPGAPIVVTDVGIIFKSIKGISLLGRSLQVDDRIGWPVQSYNHLTLVSAVDIPSRRQVRFGHSDGPTLVYDYGVGKWSVFTNHEQVDAIEVGGDYHLLKSDGTVWRQDDGFTDGDGASINRVVETPWLRLSALQGFQRLYHASVLGDYKSSHAATVKTYYDYKPGVAGTHKKKLSGKDGYSSGDPLQLRLHSGRKCEVVKFRIEDSDQLGTKESSSLSALSLELGGKGGIFKQGRAKTI